MVKRWAIIGYCPNCEQPQTEADERIEGEVTCAFCDEVYTKEEVENTPKGKY